MSIKTDRFKLLRIIFFCVLLVTAFALPFLLGGYKLYLVTQVLIYSIVILSLNLLLGYNGQASLGHGAFYAIGGYSAAVLMTQFGVPYWATVPLSGVVCFIVGFLIGFPALRLKMLYLALVTFSLAMAVPQILKNKAVEKWTGGVQGLILDKPVPPSWLPFDSDQWLYIMALIPVIVLVVIASNLVRGCVGRAIEAIRDQPIAADTMGINTAKYKTIMFGISALYTGIAGALAALLNQFVSPDSYGFFLSFTFLAGSVLGGLTSIMGAFFGAIFMVFLPNLAETFSKDAPWAVYGLFLIAIVFLMPNGVAGLIRSGLERLQKILNTGNR